MAAYHKGFQRRGTVNDAVRGPTRFPAASSATIASR